MFTDGTQRQHNRNRRSNFSGHKRFYCYGYLVTTAPDGLIIDVAGAFAGRKNDHQVLLSLNTFFPPPPLSSPPLPSPALPNRTKTKATCQAASLRPKQETTYNTIPQWTKAFIRNLAATLCTTILLIPWPKIFQMISGRRCGWPMKTAYL